jgi:parvulin-like peptidyl-prolyl isomerase
MKSLPTILTSAVVVFAFGCTEVSDPNAAATWDGGRATVAEVEAVLDAEVVRMATDLDAIVEAYRTAAERLAATRIAFVSDGDDRRAVKEDLDLDEASLKHEALIDLFIQRELMKQINVSRSQIEDYFADNEEIFTRLEQRFVLYIYRRNREPERPEQTIALLEDLRVRAESGETFEQLASEYSDSETRLLGGRLGWIGRGRLPSALEEVVFSLTVDEISDPVPSQDGGFLFLVTDAVEPMSFSLEDVETLIGRRLVRLELDRLCAELANEGAISGESLILEPDDVLPRLQESADEDIVLQVGQATVDAATIRERADQTRGEDIQWTTPDDRIREVYASQANRLRMLSCAAVIELGDDPKVVEAIDRRVQAQIRRTVDEARVEALLLARVDENRETIETFYLDNAFLYQTSLAIRLETLSVPVTAAGERVTGRLQDLRSRLETGSLTLSEAAAEVGGRVDKLGWLDTAAIAALEPKVRTYILDLDGIGYTVPFQLNRELHLIHVVERREPTVLPLDEVYDRVRMDYYTRHQQQIFREWLDELLAEHDYRFHEATVRGSFNPGSPPAE